MCPMRKRLKRKRRACGLCKPHKKGMENRWKTKEFARLKEAEAEVRSASRGTASERADDDAFLRSAGGWKGLVDAEKLIRDIYNDRLICTRPVPKL